MTAIKWTPTHRITRGDEVALVMLDPNREIGDGDIAAYTRAEWKSDASADYGVDSDGYWSFQGQPIAGTVERVMEVITGYRIRTTRYYYGPHRRTRTEPEGYETREAARARIAEYEAAPYYLDHDETGRPTYCVIARREIVPVVS